MKSVLVIDKPTCCDECKLSSLQDDGALPVLFCPTAGYIDVELGKSEIHKDCPLKDLPNKEVSNPYDFEHYSNGVSTGWNNFRDKIYKEEK